MNKIIAKIFTVNGNWGQWQAWGSCSQICGNGTQQRSRLCDNPAPSGNGTSCTGNDREVQACNTDECSGNLL